MRVTNNNALPFSLLKADGAYEVLEAGKTGNIDIHPSQIDDYRSKGFVIETDGKGDADGGAGKANDQKDTGKATPAPAAQGTPTPSAPLTLDLNAVPAPAKK